MVISKLYNTLIDAMVHLSSLSMLKYFHVIFRSVVQRMREGYNVGGAIDMILREHGPGYAESMSGFWNSTEVTEAIDAIQYISQLIGGGKREGGPLSPSPNKRTAEVNAAGTNICRDWNNGKTCIRLPCSYAHVCSVCHDKGHKRTDCPKAKEAATGAK